MYRYVFLDQPCPTEMRHRAKIYFVILERVRKHSTLKRNYIKIKVKMNAESSSDYLSFVSKLWCSLKKKVLS